MPQPDTKFNVPGPAPGEQDRDEKTDSSESRRHFLTVATATVGVVATLFAAIPFVASLRPSRKAQALGGSVTVGLRPLEPGAQVTVIWRGKPIWILRRTPEMLERMSADEWVSKLKDPASTVTAQQPPYARNAYRSIRPEYFVAVALCTHLGCVPLYRPEPSTPGLGDDWIGGYFCPCHGSRFDLAGRVMKDVPAPTNLVVPPYRFRESDVIEIGVDSNTG